MKPHLAALLGLLLVPLLHAASTKQRPREPLSQNARPDAVEHAIVASLQDLLEDAQSFFEPDGPRSVRAILRLSSAEGKVAPGSVSRSKLAAASVKLQEQASAALADLSTVMRGVQERLGRSAPGVGPDVRRQYEALLEEARELSSAISGYSNHFKQATRGEIGQWISFEYPALPDKRDRNPKSAPAAKSRGMAQTISGFLVY